MERSLNILLVDDDDVDRMAVRRALNEANINANLTEVVNGAEALAALEGGKFDCVLLDHHLPDSTGVAVFTDMLKSNENKTAVIFLTGEEDENLAVRMMEIGAIDYLTKNEISASVLGRAIKYAKARQFFLTRLTALGQVDALTGLPNRAVFDIVLKKATAQAKRVGNMVAVALLDLDHFKDVNDSLGHPAGDELLKLVAERLSGIVRETDTVLRLGGDEFVIIVTNLTDADGAAKLARKVVETLTVPFDLDEQSQFVSTSVGIALAPADGESPAELLKAADLALYKAKGEGRGRYRFYDEGMQTAALNRRSLESNLREAIKREELVLYYQPKLSVKTGSIVGVEALLRWQHPERGLVSPVDFIPIAEASHLIIGIGEWVLQTACRQSVAWRNAGFSALNCSINLSPLQLRDTKLVGVIDAAIKQSGIDPAFLEVEITESTIMNNVETVSATLGKLRERGVAVSIDDFGTGYSSLALLKQLPLDKLKIDRTFVADVTTDSDDAEIASAIISLGQNLGLEVIAEGVEELAQLEFLRLKGCDQAQGFYFSPPLPAEEFADWFRHYQNRPTLVQASR